MSAYNSSKLEKTYYRHFQRQNPHKNDTLNHMGVNPAVKSTSCSPLLCRFSEALFLCRISPFLKSQHHTKIWITVSTLPSLRLIVFHTNIPHQCYDSAPKQDMNELETKKLHPQPTYSIQDPVRNIIDAHQRVILKKTELRRKERQRNQLPGENAQHDPENIPQCQYAFQPKRKTSQ